MENFKLIIIALVLLYIPPAVIAQDDVDESLKTIFLAHSFLEIDFSDFTVSLVKTDIFDISIDVDPFVTKLRIVVPKIPVFKNIFISTSLPNPYIGSPAYDIINTWRNSLNIDVVTGKYWWEL